MNEITFFVNGLIPCLRTTYKEHADCTPAQLVFGEDLVLPGQPRFERNHPDEYLRQRPTQPDQRIKAGTGAPTATPPYVLAGGVEDS